PSRVDTKLMIISLRVPRKCDVSRLGARAQSWKGIIRRRVALAQGLGRRRLRVSYSNAETSVPGGAATAVVRDLRFPQAILNRVHSRNYLPMANETFPIDLGKLEPLKLDPAVTTLTDAQKATLKHNIQLCRDAIVFFTALAGAKGLSGHT